MLIDSWTAKVFQIKSTNVSYFTGWAVVMKGYVSYTRISINHVYWYIQDSYCEKLTHDQTISLHLAIFYHPRSIGEIHIPQFNKRKVRLNRINLSSALIHSYLASVYPRLLCVVHCFRPDKCSAYPRQHKWFLRNCPHETPPCKLAL